MKILLTTLAVAGLALSPGAVLAQATSSLPAGTSFEDVDTDGDDLVSWSEFQLVLTDISQEQFDTADADGNGSLDAAEFDSLFIETGSVAPQHEQFAPMPSTIPQDPE